MSLLNALIDLAKQEFGESISDPVSLKGDGSDRKIYRFRQGSESWVGVTNPHHDENYAFIVLSQHLAQRGIPVPHILSTDLSNGCYLLEDLGDVSLADCLTSWNASHPPDTEAILQAYHKVLYWLPRFQIEGHQGLDYSFCLNHVELAEAVFRWDMNYFREFFWEIFAHRYPRKDSILRDLEGLIQRVCQVERNAFVSCDFQSRNIMWKAKTPYFIDYQSGCQGAIHYDFASLLYASRSGLNDTLREQLIKTYLYELRPWIKLSHEEFIEDFYHFVLARRLRSLGTYGFLPTQKGKLYFLDAIPNTIREIDQLLREHAPLSQWQALQGLFAEWKEEKDLCDIVTLYQTAKTVWKG